MKGYNTVAELILGLTEYFAFYNGERPTSRWATGRRTRSMPMATVAGRASQTIAAKPGILPAQPQGSAVPL